LDQKQKSELLERNRDLWLRKAGQYKATFESDSGKFVLGDLFHICNAGATTYRGSRDDALVAEGRRQVWIHIMSMTRSSDEEIYRLAAQRIQIERDGQ